jgi:S1-C subfamily serine protease
MQKEENQMGKLDRPERLPGKVLRRLPSFLPFVLGILAALSAIFLYNTLTPKTQQLTITDVNDAVSQAMQAATPPAAYSARVFESIQPSIVLIQSQLPGKEGEEQGSRIGTGASRIGTGVIVSDMGDILTSLHVVEDAAVIQVLFADGTRTTAQIAAAQPEIDIAVLSADMLPAFVVPAVLGNPGALNVGDEAFVVGNPFGLYASMSAGVISGFDRSFQTQENEQVLQGLIQIDTAVNPGNSGGPLLNREGHVVGIVVGILNPVDQEFFVGIGFAVPITIAGGVAGAPFY